PTLRALPPFPTRRSSDLVRLASKLGSEGAVEARRARSRAHHQPPRALGSLLCSPRGLRLLDGGLGALPKRRDRWTGMGVGRDLGDLREELEAELGRALVERRARVRREPVGQLAAP